MTTSLLRHLSANSVKLLPFEFKRELAMEAYILENEQVLGLDDGQYAGSEVTIIQEEAFLKNGRQSRGTDGRIDILVRYNADTIGVVELKLGDLQDVHLAQLADYIEEKERIYKKYADVLGIDERSKPNWVGLLVGNSIDPSLMTKLRNGHVVNDVPIGALTINRYRSTRGEVFVVTDTYFKAPSSRDTTKYKFRGQSYGKGRLVHAVISVHVAESGDITLSELKRDFPNKLQGSIGVVLSVEEAVLRGESKSGIRHYVREHEVIPLASGTNIAVCSQWGRDNLVNFLKKAKEHGYKITEDRA